jgi:hypothetical protein
MISFSKFLYCPLLVVVGLSASAQDSGSAPDPGGSQDNADAQNAGPKHIFGIVPNFRTSPSLREYKPLSVREKFRIAKEDSFDRGTVALAAAFAGISQLENSNPSFGQGTAGYFHRWATSYTDFAVGNFMTEGIFPGLLHQDPRFFRRGTGGGLSRVCYAISQTFVTHGDSGHLQFNASEILGNSTSVAIGMSYYPDNRDVHSAMSALASQLIVDTASNVLKEFGPDLDRKFLSHRKSKEKSE